MPVIKVLLVDDHAVVRAGYRFMLDNCTDITVVGEADCGEKALDCFAHLAPDVVVMDLSMPGAGGLETIRQLRIGHPKARILVSTMHDSAPLVERVLQAGAVGYISKNSQPDNLIKAIVKVARGENYIDAELAQNLVVQQHDRSSPLGLLSPREMQILSMFADGIPPEEIATQLSLSSKTIANYLTQIKDKLQISSSAELVRYALSKGLAIL